MTTAPTPTLADRFAGTPLDVIAHRKFAQLIDLGRKEITIQTYRNDLHYYLNWCEENGYPTDTINQEAIDAFIADYAQRPVKPISVKLRRSGLQSLLRFAAIDPQQRDQVGHRSAGGVAGETYRVRLSRLQTPAVITLSRDSFGSQANCVTRTPCRYRGPRRHGGMQPAPHHTGRAEGPRPLWPCPQRHSCDQDCC